jgi:hypothetical protein
MHSLFAKLAAEEKRRLLDFVVIELLVEGWRLDAGIQATI